MPRIRQYAERYIVEDFQKEIRRKQGTYNLMSVRSLAAAAGIPHTTLNHKLKDPRKLSVEDLQKLVAAIHPDIGAMLELLGYPKKEINQFGRRSDGTEKEVVHP